MPQENHDREYFPYIFSKIFVKPALKVLEEMPYLATPADRRNSATGRISAPSLSANKCAAPALQYQGTFENEKEQ